MDEAEHDVLAYLSFHPEHRSSSSLLKKPYLGYSQSLTGIAVMRQLKMALYPLTP